MAMLPIKKNYIDSRNRSADSVSASCFKIELDRTVQLPDNTVFFYYRHLYSSCVQAYRKRC